MEGENNDFSGRCVDLDGWCNDLPGRCIEPGGSYIEADGCCIEPVGGCVSGRGSGIGLGVLEYGFDGVNLIWVDKKATAIRSTHFLGIGQSSLRKGTAGRDSRL